MWKIVLRALLLLLALTVLTGVLYPLAVTGVAQLFFPGQANGSLLRHQGKVIGSALIGQDFRSPQYFCGRPSAANYDATASGGFNLGPTNRVLLKTIADRVKAVRHENSLPADYPVPGDLVTASASGLDPHISPEFRPACARDSRSTERCAPPESTTAHNLPGVPCCRPRPAHPAYCRDSSGVAR